MLTSIKFYRVLKSIFQIPLRALGLPPHSCRLTPSCSHYCEDRISRFGIIKGGLMCAWRLIRCNPLTPPHYDP